MSDRVRRATMRLAPAFITLAAVSTAACFTGRLPALEYYRIGTADSTTLSTQLSATAGPAAPLPGLAIAPFEAPGLYGRNQIVFRTGEQSYGTYSSREWALPISTMLGLVTQDVLAAHPLSAQRAIFDPPSLTAYPYVWRGRVRELEEVDRGKQVWASVRLEARIVRTADQAVVWSGTAGLERPVPEGTMPAIVDALSSLSTQAMAQLADDARAALGRSAGSTAPR